MEAIFEKTEDAGFRHLVEQAVDGGMAHLPIEAVQIKDGFNPRKFFEAGALRSLAEDIRLRGIVQPLVVRPNGEGDAFWLIAGERRLRAAREAGLGTVPVIVRRVSDTEAAAMATAENLVRDDMSPSEEAKVAHRIVSLSDGDREEAARVLGWSKAKLDSRLALLHCSDGVLAALEKREIALGHAELLAGLAKELQDDSLPGIVEQNVSVAELRERMGRYAYRLADACFDTAACKGCPHNSGSVVDLFEQTLDEGRCLNRECYDQKAEAYLIEKKSVLADTYPVIWLDSEKDAASRVYLQRDGSQGVGREQFAACQGCAHHGALMLTAKGREGEVETGLCFNTTCNREKVKAYQAALQAEREDGVENTNAPEKPKDTASANTAPKTGGATKAKAKPDELPARVKEFIRDRHMEAVTCEVRENGHLVRAVSAYALHKANSHGKSAKAALEAAGVGTLRHDRAETLEAFLRLDDTQLDALITGLAASVAGETGFHHGDEYRGGKVILKAAKADLAKHYTVDKAYLETLTIKAILDLLTEAKFGQWYDRKHGDQAYGKWVKGKKRNELIDAIVESGFDWSGFVPKAFDL